jgi:hypothetical protein
MDWVQAIIEWMGALFTDTVEFFEYLPIEILNDFLLWIADFLGQIPVPEFVEDGLQDLVSGLPPMLSYLLDGSNLTECMAMIGSAYVFRLTRKMLTFGWW